MIEITKVEAVEDVELDKLAKIAPECFERPQKFRAIEKGCRPADNITASRRRTNVLKRYINRIRAICLLNAFASLILAAIYTQTRNESIFAAMVVCEVNAMIAWAMN